MAAMARQVGVPSIWLDDAIQDIQIECWRAGDYRKIVIRRAAIDAARRYGPRNRYGTSRETEPVDGLSLLANDSPEHEAEVAADLAAVLAAIKGFSLRERTALTRSIRGTRQTDGDYTAAYRARQKLRRLVA